MGRLENSRMVSSSFFPEKLSLKTLYVPSARRPRRTLGLALGSAMVPQPSGVLISSVDAESPARPRLESRLEALTPAPRLPTIEKTQISTSSTCRPSVPYNYSIANLGVPNACHCGSGLKRNLGALKEARGLVVEPVGGRFDLIDVPAECPIIINKVIL